MPEEWFSSIRTVFAVTSLFGFAAAAALSVSALLARADLTVLQDECERLEQSIVELSEVHDHLVIERESRPGALSAGQEAEQAPAGCITHKANGRGMENYTFRIQVDPLDCQGCGACTVACMSGAMDLRGFMNKQIMAEVDAICK